MRYVILLLLNLPIIFLALINIVTQYNLRRISTARFRRQLLLWLAILLALTCSFPAYNLFSSNPVLDSSELSLFDIVQTTAIVYMIYVLNNQRRKIEQNEKRLKDLHQEISIKLSE